MTEPSKPAELLARTAARDEAAFLALYELLAPRVMGLIRQTLPDREAAREVLTEVFVHLWSEARRLSANRASVEVWVALRARARAVDRSRSVGGLRRRARSRLDSLPKGASWLPAGNLAALLDTKRNLLGKILRQLPKSQTQLLELAIFKGLTTQEIATQLDEPAGKIQTDLRAALRFLRHRLRAVMGVWTAAI